MKKGSNTKKKRPGFRKVKAKAGFKNPEELFYSLQGREKSHGYLRGPQQDVLRNYTEISNVSDVAFELPTGTGKTAVGLLIAEWRRRQTKSRVAYLTLTNQLAQQVMEEARRLDIDYADLTGSREERDPKEVGRYLDGQAIAITSFSNLFNVNPVIAEPDTIILDDAHGGENYVADMWTTRIDANAHPQYFDSAFAAIRPALTDAQFRHVTDPEKFRVIEIGDLHRHSECVVRLTNVLDEIEDNSVRFSWGMIRHRLDVCLLLVSQNKIVLRPLTPPTHTHRHFADAAQRIYMSATLSGKGDLYRSYGVTKVEIVRAEHPQWGRRYVFVPGLIMSDDSAHELVADVWGSLDVRRAVLLAPSKYQLDWSYGMIHQHLETAPNRMSAADIAESLDSFTSDENAILTLAGRYDGLDLPDDTCRLLIMAYSPVAIGELEQHLMDFWKLGPVLRRRERTRLMQGMGRCTRNPTDFAVIIWLGQSLVNSATNSKLVGGMPTALRAEIAWGNEQVQFAEGEADELYEMIVGLLQDSDYRKDANQAIDEITPGAPIEDPELFEEAGREEVKFTRALWSEDYTGAHRVAREIIDRLGVDELSGYRAWWCYLAAIAAHKLGDNQKEKDALVRGRACGVNTGRFEAALMRLGKIEQPDPNEIALRVGENIWGLLDQWGWAGIEFKNKIEEMLDGLSQSGHKKFHVGLDYLGQVIGADVIRSTSQGVPDVVWSLPGNCYIAIEAKSEKDHESQLSKKDILQAKGHIDWVKQELCGEVDKCEVLPVIVADTTTLHSAATPHVQGLFHKTTEEIQEFGESVATAIAELRIEYSGAEFAEKGKEFATALEGRGISISAVKDFVTARPL